MLKLSNIQKDYVVTKDLTVHALRGVSIDFRDNEFVSILGPSGCGKTTLLNIIGGLDQYSGGDLSIDGISTKSYKESQWNGYRNNRIGFVFQSYNLIPHQSIVENVELALTLSGIGKKKRRERAISALKEVGLDAELYKKPNQLSGGQMQRVAIARALVNDPQIVLADEPTGALDSVTSVQVLDLLQKVAKNHLVIMVTHNAELAEQYSTRIIKLKDGVMVSDSNPYTAPLQQSNNDKSPKVNTVPAVKEKVKMSFGTALSLSFKNLLTKKGRTLMTSFAGSIGIIGVALVLAISNGFNMYIAQMQMDTLSGAPIEISANTFDIQGMRDAMMDMMGEEQPPEYPAGDNNIHVYEPPQFNPWHTNDLSKDYIDFVNDYYIKDKAKPADQRTIVDLQYGYATPLNVFTESADQYDMIDSSAFQEALGNSEFVKSQYDVLDNGRYPANANEIAIVIDSRNRVSTTTLDALGIPYTTNGEGDDVSYDKIAFSDVIGKQYYTLTYDKYLTIGDSTAQGNDYNTVYNLSNESTDRHDYLAGTIDNGAIPLEIVGIMRVKEGVSSGGLYGTGILYLPSLTQQLMTANMNSDFATAQNTARDSGYVYTEKKQDKTVSSYTLAPLNDSFGNKLFMQLKMEYGQDLTIEEAYDKQYQKIGLSELPTSIAIYPTDFDGKEQILSVVIDQWNDMETNQDNPIVFMDMTEMMSDSMGQMIDIISYVLIAFASISLVVSSVMIGIITYVSVIERTKEIGVLRSLGASKRDVSNVFNAESFLIGLTAGILGIGITYLLSVPINIIILALAGDALTTNLAILNPIAGLVLVIISCVLTLVSGSIPSRYAAKLDPVKALRSE